MEDSEQRILDSPSNSAYSEDARGELADRISELLGCKDARPVILGCLAEYEITKKNKGLIVYDGGETEYLVKRFVIAKKVKGCTDRTCKLYHDNLMRLFKVIGKSPTQCDHTDIQAMLAGLIVRGTSKAYQQNVARTFSSFYGWLTREEIIVKNIMLKVDAIQAKPKHKDAFTDMDVERIRMACRTGRERALIEILLSTGCRIFEAAKLKREEVNAESVRIIGKGEKERTVYLNAKAQLAVQSYLRERRDENPYVFPASIYAGRGKDVTEFPALKGQKTWYLYPDQVSADQHMDNSSLEAIVRHIGKAAGVKNCHPHRFRRTCATLALRRGMNLVHVQQMLGHDSLATTQRYLDISSEELKEAHRRFVV